jgi:hypothetical protein
MGRRYLFTRLPAWRQKWGVPSRRASRRVAGGGWRDFWVNKNKPVHQYA